MNTSTDYGNITRHSFVPLASGNMAVVQGRSDRDDLGIHASSQLHTPFKAVSFARCSARDLHS